jgi:ABC-type multidrug transport system ATPase subunit
MIEFDRVTKKYKDLTVLDDVSFSIARGEVVGMSGQSGVGKSTILKLIAGILQPSSGRVRTQASRLPLRARGICPYEASATGRRLMDWLGLHGFEDTFPARLSGGMQQRVALARALAIKPDLLLMDEPFNGLDPHLKDNIFNLLEKKIEKDLTTVLYVSHYLEELSRLASRTIHFKGGKLT